MEGSRVRSEKGNVSSEENHLFLTVKPEDGIYCDSERTRILPTCILNILLCNCKFIRFSYSQYLFLAICKKN